MATETMPSYRPIEYEENKYTVNTHTTTTIVDKVHSQSKSKTKPDEHKIQIVWPNVVWYIVLHAITVYGIYLGLKGRVYVKTLICMMFLSSCSTLGITAGAHRLWSHRCYSARIPVQILLATLQTLAGQNSIYEWVRDHRKHHKYVDTDSDPYNASRGFFFSHMGWLLVRKHPSVKSSVDMKDMEADPIIMFQKKYYSWLMPLITFLIPSLIPYWLWQEDLWYSFIVVGVTRYVVSLHITWLVNSAAHMWGTRPYDKNITSRQNWLVSLLALGEGWHNYHHAFPWDYKAAELGNYRLNLSTMFIDVCARFGLVYNLKTATSNIIEKRSLRTGTVK